ncbi:ribosome biogenesis protein Sqt1 [Schizosaccharomyces octosporus yFS286]|uniref:Ribosome biogenesis protein Sqt1 n=1 Tax=Schizosaccharomyces octosporus (strain yFS286) TaxID=483514 RepID=S9PZY0_SCHOY|nr:ribosome biogenesis protein Sqt1 [Schizosaccharomyces octosporus yFS286]EPX73023.1 ribosome biogenesis protein Sqt1 [Schizosaccharomyces octosporus yFS286]
MAEEENQEVYLQENEVEEVVNQDENEMEQDFEENEELDQDQGAGEIQSVMDLSVQGFFEHKDSVFCVSMNPVKSNLCVSGGGDDLAYIWDITTGEQVCQLTGHKDSVVSVGWSFDGNYVATGGMDNQIRVWKTESGVEFITATETTDEIVWLNWHPKGLFLAAGCNDGSVWMLSMPSGKVVQVFYGHTAPTNAGKFIPPGVGKRLATVDDMGTLIVWNPATGDSECRMTGDDHRFDPGNEETSAGWTSFDSNSDGNVLFLGGSSGKVKVVNINNNYILASLETQHESVESISLCPTLPICACASVDGTVALYDSSSLKFRRSLYHGQPVIDCAFLPNSPYLLTACADCIIRKWDVRSGQLLGEYTGHQEPILCMSVTADGKRVISGSDDTELLVFDCEK